MRKFIPWVIVLVLGAAAFTACGDPEPNPTPTVAPTATATATATPAPSPTPPPTATPPPTSTPAPTAIPTIAPTATPSSQPSTTGELSAQGVLAASLIAMSQAKSFHFVVEALVTVVGDGDSVDIPINFEGDFQSPDRIRGTLSLSLGFFKIETETIAIGDTTYTKSPESGKWEVGAELGDAIPGFAELVLPGTTLIPGLLPVLSGIVTLDGNPQHLLKATLPDDIFGEEGFGGEAEFWIDVDNFTISQIVATGETTAGAGPIPFGGSGSGGNASLTLTITLTDYDEPVEIEAPTVP